MPRIFKHLEAGCLQVNLMSTSAQINQLKYTILFPLFTRSPASFFPQYTPAFYPLSLPHYAFRTPAFYSCPIVQFDMTHSVYYRCRYNINPDLHMLMRTHHNCTCCVTVFTR